MRDSQGLGKSCLIGQSRREDVNEASPHAPQVSRQVPAEALHYLGSRH